LAWILCLWLISAVRNSSSIFWYLIVFPDSVPSSLMRSTFPCNIK
jgi:hypothetical protein